MKTITANTDSIHWLDRLCRSGLFKTLDQLHTGLLRIYEGEQYHEFGKPESELQACIYIDDYEAYRSIALTGSVGAGEAYMTGDWRCDDLPTLIRILARNKDVVDGIDSGWASLGQWLLKGLHYMNRNTAKGSRRNIAALS